MGDRNYLFHGGPWDGEWHKSDGRYMIRVPYSPHPHSLAFSAGSSDMLCCSEPLFKVGEYRKSKGGYHYVWDSQKVQQDYHHPHGEIKVTVECGHGTATTCGHVKTTVILDCAQ